MNHLNEAWLTHENAKSNAESLIAEIHREIQSKDGNVTTVLENEAINAWNARNERRAILRDWFQSSIGIEQNGERDTCYITEARVGAQFASLGVYSWTGWIGDLVTKVRNSIEDGIFPERLVYGQPGREIEAAVGPFVRYAIKDAQILRIDFNFKEQIPSFNQEAESTTAENQLSFGLRTLIQTIDLEQNSQIRGALTGIYILTGGPGTGKTSVALHRIPYLLDAHEKKEVVVPPGAIRVSEDNTLIVVWEPHLVPYLSKCLERLGISKIPRENVACLFDWLRAQIRGYIPFGLSPDYQLEEETNEFSSRIKKCLTEQDLQSFLNQSPSLADAKKIELEKCISTLNQIKPQLEKRFVNSAPQKPEFKQLLESGEVTYRNVLSRTSSLLSLFESLPNPQKEDKKIIEKLSKLKLSIVGCELVAVLKAFYLSATAANKISANFGANAVAQFQEQLVYQKPCTLSQLDCYLLLWIVHLPETSKLLGRKLEPLPRYGHIMIDEAQYYEPIVIRLLASLCEIPNGVMTIVGDIEQRVSLDGGLVTWESSGLPISKDNIKRLEVNYRWTQQIFDFLQIFRDATKIGAIMKRPRRWLVQGVDHPRVCTFDSVQSEIEFVTEQITQIRNTTERRHWTIAVIVPDYYEEEIKFRLVKNLRAFGVESEWVVGDHVQDSVHKVIATKYTNIVGLEFDAVFVLGVGEVLSAGGKDSYQAVWVAISRPHRFLCVTSVGDGAIFDNAAFDSYREDSSFSEIS
jgi:hypothetical protein